MIEQKLYRAAQALPTPKTDFREIVNIADQNKKNQTVYTGRCRKAAVILVCVLLLLGSAGVAATTEVNYSAWATHSGSFEDAHNIAAELGVVLPEALGSSPFYNITTMYVAPEGTTYFDALANPDYPWHSVDYGVQKIVREYDSEEPGSGFSETSVVYDEYGLSFGSTDTVLFRYVFALDETGTRILENAIPGSYRTEEYNGITMQIVTEVQYDSEEIFAYHHRVIWVDSDHHAVFSLHKSFYADEDAADQFPDEMIVFAKGIIDENR